MSSYYSPREQRSLANAPAVWTSGPPAYATANVRVTSGPIVRRGATPLVLAVIAMVLLLGIVGVGGFILFRPELKAHTPSTHDPVTFAVPAGFTATELQSDYAGDDPVFTRAYRLTNGPPPQQDLIIIDAFKPDTSALSQSDAQLEARVRALVANFQGTVTSVTPTTVDGQRASEAIVTYPREGAQLSQRTYFIYAPKNLIQIRCQWVQNAPAIDQGCKELIDDIKIG